MKPYYQDNSVTIYHGDCREILPELEPVDLVLTDPPYGLGDKWQGGKEYWPLHHGQMAWDANIIAELPELIKIGRQQIVWGGHLYPLPASRCWFIWDKLSCNDQWTSGQAEMAWTNFDRPIRVWRSYSPPPAILAAKDHPTQKPLELLTWCFKFTDGETIIDPFMGSGTTLRAAKDLGRKAIGIEIEEKYCEIAAQRMAQEVLQLCL